MGFDELTFEKRNEFVKIKCVADLIEKKCDRNGYIKCLLSLCEIVGTIERAYGLPHSSLFVEEKILDELALMGIEDLGPCGTRTSEYSKYLRSLDYETVIPHIVVIYGLILIELNSFKFSQRLQSESEVDLINIIENYKNTEIVEEANYAIDQLVNIAKELNMSTVEFIK